MSKERIVQATFPDGTVLTRGSVSKQYTHAWLVVYSRSKEQVEQRAKEGYTGGEPFKRRKFSGFASSLLNAERAMRANLSGFNIYTTVEYSGVVAVVEVVAKRSLIST